MLECHKYNFNKVFPGPIKMIFLLKFKLCAIKSSQIEGQDTSEQGKTIEQGPDNY